MTTIPAKRKLTFCRKVKSNETYVMFTTSDITQTMKVPYLWPLKKVTAQKQTYSHCTETLCWPSSTNSIKGSNAGDLIDKKSTSRKH